MNTTVETTTGGRPLQVISWAEKQRNNQEWFKKTADFYIHSSTLFSGNNARKQTIQTLYEVYNNKFPTAWFSHVTDPLSAKNPQHKAFPAKVRPVNILRTNLDLLMAEYPRRPFVAQVNNLGEDGFNRYTDALNKKIEENVMKYYQLQIQQQAIQEGLMGQDGQPVSEDAAKKIQEMMDTIEPPEQTAEQFNTTYRDKIAIKGQKWLTRAIREHDVKPKLLKLFKDWLVAGEVYTYKDVHFDNLVYERISPLHIDHDKSEGVTDIEDGEWVVVKRMLTISDVVDMFYEDLKTEQVKEMETTSIYQSATNFQTYLSGIYSANGMHTKIPVWHVQWKGKKKLGFRTFIDPETNQPAEDEVDENYIPLPDEQIDWRQVNEVYEVWRLGDKEYVQMGPLAIQRNAMNNFSKCKLSYNGRKYSDTHAENISAMEIGLPYQIMSIIVNRTLELTIAKSKGKILLIDQNAIPKGNGWDDEKFFYYAESLGYALMNRNQMGVDKTWNQYQALDMSLFENIKQLIELQDFFKQQWDDIIGVNRQRKGQTYASDAVGVTERAAFQSTVMTDMIFNLFEEFVEKELQGMLDLSRFTNASGVRKMWYDTEVGTDALEIDPNEYCNAELGVFLESAAEAMAIKNKIEANVTAMIQNGSRASTIFEVLHTQNLAELKMKLKRIEELADKAAQATAQSEEEAAQAADDRKKQFMEYEKMLDTTYMNAEYDRKEDIEQIKGTFNTFTFQDGDADKNGVPDAVQAQKIILDREKFEHEKTTRLQDRADRKQKEAQDLAVKQQELAIKRKAANKKPSK